MNSSRKITAVAVNRSAKKTVKHCFFIVVLVCLLTGFSFAQLKKPNNDKEIVFAVLPFDNTLVLAKTFYPLAKYLEKAGGIKIRFATAPTWDLFMERLETGQYDIVYGNPYHYIKAHDALGYKIIAKVSGEPFTGILLVRKKSTIKTIKDLIGKTIALPHRDAWAAYWLTKYHLLKHGIDIDKQSNLIFVESHNRSILACFHGLTDVAATWRPIRLINKDIKDSLTVLLETEPHPNMPVFVNPNLNGNISDKIKKALLTLHKSNEGREILKKLQQEKFVEAYDSDYNTTRDICKKLSCQE